MTAFITYDELNIQMNISENGRRRCMYGTCSWSYSDNYSLTIDENDFKDTIINDFVDQNISENDEIVEKIRNY